MKHNEPTIPGPYTHNEPTIANAYYPYSGGSEIPPPPPHIHKARRRAIIFIGVVCIVLASVIGGYVLRTNKEPQKPNDHPTSKTMTTSSPTPSPAPSITPTPNLNMTDKVNIYDEAGVLNTSQVQSAGANLQYPVNIYTMNNFTGTETSFNQEAVRTLNDLHNPRLIVISIDTHNKFLAIVGGKDVSTSNSVYNDAVNAFKTNYNGGDYTGATIASIHSLQSSLGAAGTKTVAYMHGSCYAILCIV